MTEAAAGLAGRRAFFRWLAREGAVKFDELRGRPQLRLNDLPQLPPGQVAGLKPCIAPGVEIIPTNDCVLARVPGRAKLIMLFPLHSGKLARFNRFNGASTLAEVAEAVCAENGEPPEAAFAATRSLFLRLTALGVCVPANIPPPAGSMPEPVVPAPPRERPA